MYIEKSHCLFCLYMHSWTEIYQAPLWQQLKKGKKNLLFRVYLFQREHRANTAVGFDKCRVKWLIYNAASLVAFAESIEASQDQWGKKMKPKANSQQRSVWGDHSLKQKTPSEQLWMASFTLNFHSPLVIRDGWCDWICNLGHTRNAYSNVSYFQDKNLISVLLHKSGCQYSNI